MKLAIGMKIKVTVTTGEFTGQYVVLGDTFEIVGVTGQDYWIRTSTGMTNVPMKWALKQLMGVVK